MAGGTRRRAATLGTAFLLGSATLGAAATPASAQPHVDCWGPITPVCGVVNKVLADGPSSLDKLRSIVLPVYDEVTGTVRCVISGECP